MNKCSPEDLKMIPLYKVVNAAIVDDYQDIGRVQQLYSHWAARGLRKLNTEVLKTNVKEVLLRVNHNTNTSTLPIDVDDILFVGIIDEFGDKIPLKSSDSLIHDDSVEDIECEDKCEKCNQSKSIISDIVITEDTTLVTVNDAIYEQTVIKKMYPDGSYYLETKIPVWDVESNAVIYVTNKEYITTLDLKPCGCLEDTEENIQRIKTFLPDIYCKCYSGCSSCGVDYGKYRVYEDAGLIQFSKFIPYDKIYVKYRGFLPKKNGQYQVPAIAFETLVEWTRFKAIDGKKNVPIADKNYRWSRYRIEKANLLKIKSRVSLSFILSAALELPKFDFNSDCNGVNSYPPSTRIVASNSALLSGASGGSSSDSSVSSSSSSGSSNSSSDGCNVTLGEACPCPSKGLVPFTLAVISSFAQGVPQPGATYYQNDSLKGAIGLNVIVVNNQNESAIAGNFTFDPVTGTIDRSPNVWVAGDTLIANFSKYI